MCTGSATAICFMLANTCKFNVNKHLNRVCDSAGTKLKFLVLWEEFVFDFCGRGKVKTGLVQLTFLGGV